MQRAHLHNMIPCKIIDYEKVECFVFSFASGLRAQTALRGVVALRYQHHHGGVDNKVLQLQATLSVPLD